MITGLFGNKAAKPATAGKPGAPGGENAAADPAGAANGAGAANVAGAGSPHGPANAVTSGGGGGRPPIPEMASDSALTGGAADAVNQSARQSATRRAGSRSDFEYDSYGVRLHEAGNSGALRR